MGERGSEGARKREGARDRNRGVDRDLKLDLEVLISSQGSQLWTFFAPLGLLSRINSYKI